ncbi:P-loop containing nucleoside triphosphate hydrolase protein [Leptodontidium sp. MPI-SDFR-AT-0119]|nr:P-loop containing nucleoside triphosphate hydrolase protein [Leptodontidium sp. MPI-SDFR-AT-0119]
MFTFDDFVIGKGRGIVILLDGPPGIGKTLTAESVAETIKAPLYTISAGELGSQSHNNAVLLIDEADIFMEQRTPYELDRNELVAIFLRHMEYFHGVMILTTNRVETMDVVFDSRVDIRLHYLPLPASSCRLIWANFLARLPEKSTFTDAKLDQLAKLDLNRRQIESAIKTAQLLPSRKGEGVKIEHVGTVLRITRGVLL